MRTRRAIGWALLAVGTLVTLWGGVGVFDLVVLMDRFGLFYNADTLSAARWLIAEAVGIVLVGLSMALFGGWLVTRKQRAKGPSAPSHFD